MAHFARLDNANTVVEVVVISNEDIFDVNNNESEELGITFCQSLFDTTDTFVQTSYNYNFRNRFAGLNYTYDEENDVFIAYKPYPSWVLNSEFEWESPVPKPDYEWVSWDEDSVSWIDEDNPNVGKDGIDYSDPSNDWEATHIDWKSEE